MSLDDALTNFEINISPWKNPLEWIHADAQYINSIIQGITTLATTTEIVPANFTGQDVIYPVCSPLSPVVVLNSLIIDCSV